MGLDEQYETLLNMTDRQAADILRKAVRATEARGNGKSITYAALRIAMLKAIEALESKRKPECKTCVRFEDENRRTCKVCKNLNLYKPKQ